MQVNRVHQSQNFGMALRIKQGAGAKLKEMPIETLKRIQEAGEALKDTKYYHVEIGEDLTPKMVSKPGAYWGEAKTSDLNIHRSKTAKTDVMMLNKDKGDLYGASKLYSDNEMVQHNIWALWTNSIDSLQDINHLARVAKTFDEAAVKNEKTQQELAAIAKEKQAEVNSVVNDLMKKYTV